MELPAPDESGREKDLVADLVDRSRVDVPEQVPGGMISSPRGEGVVSQYNRTDVGNCRRFVDLFGDRVRYCPAWKKWLVWKGTHWATDEKGGAYISDLCKQMARKMAEQAASNADAAHALKCEAQKTVSNYLEFVKGEVAVDPEELDADPWLLNCTNGAIHLSTRYAESQADDRRRSGSCSTPFPRRIRVRPSVQNLDYGKS